MEVKISKVTEMSHPRVLKLAFSQLAVEAEGVGLGN